MNGANLPHRLPPGCRRRDALVLHGSVTVGPRYYADPALAPHNGTTVLVDYWDTDPSVVLVSSLDGRLIKRIVDPRLGRHPDGATPEPQAPIGELVGKSMQAVIASGTAWAFNAEQLQRALDAYFIGTGELDPIEAALFKGLMVGFLMSDEAGKLRIATPKVTS